MRCFVIGVRYGLMNPARYEFMYKKVGVQYLCEDFLFHAWIKTKPQKIQEEMKAVKYRLEIEDSDFNLTFIQDIPKLLAEKLSKCDYYQGRLTLKLIYKIPNFNKAYFFIHISIDFRFFELKMKDNSIIASLA